MWSEPDGAGRRRAGGPSARPGITTVLVSAAAVAAGAVAVLAMVNAGLTSPDSPATAAAAAAARQNVFGYEVTAAARAVAGEDPIARRRGIQSLEQSMLQLTAGPPAALREMAEHSGRTDGVAVAYDELAVAAGNVVGAAQAGEPLAPHLGELERRAELYRLGIDAILFDIGMVAEAELDEKRRFGLLLQAAAGLLAVALATLALRTRRHPGEHAPAAGANGGHQGRAMLAQRLGDAIVRAQRSGRLAALLLADIDLFKAINDRHGPEVGDALLRQVEQRIRATIRDSDTVAHMGGDEFAVVVEGVQLPEDAGRVAEKLLLALNRPFELGDRDMRITASVGIVLYPLDGLDVYELLRTADIAMYAAKESGRDRYQFFTRELRARTSERLSLIEGLRGALERPEELELVYQPKIDMASGELVGVEALLRWHHPELGTVLPDRFIKVAEESDLIVALGRWVIGEACTQAEQWRQAGQERLKVSVNVSSRQFRQGDLVETISDALTAAGLDPHWLEVELTEGTLAEDTALVRRTLERLKAMGVKVAIDDFGTGYSSLSYLKRFPIDALKIDRSFIRDVTEDPDDAAISQAIVSLARSLRLQVVAEGVETPEQLEFVRDLGCDTVQGFLISEPLPVDGVGEFVVRLDERAVV